MYKNDKVQLLGMVVAIKCHLIFRSCVKVSMTINVKFSVVFTKQLSSCFPFKPLNTVTYCFLRYS